MILFSLFPADGLDIARMDILEKISEHVVAQIVHGVRHLKNVDHVARIMELLE